MSDDLFLKGIGSGFSAEYSRQKVEMDRLSRIADLNKKGAATAESQKVKEKAATEFEGMMLKQMLGAMWRTVPENGMLSGSREEQYYREFLNDAVSKHISETQSIGIKEVILRDMNKYDGGEEK